MIRAKKQEAVFHVVCPVLPEDFPKVVTLCGSTRFGDAFRDALRKETLKGRIVLNVGLLGHAEGIDMDGPVKVMLDELHKRKIDLSDEILVLNVNRPYCPRCDQAVDAKVCMSMFGPDTWHCVKCQGITEFRPYIGSSTRSEIEYAIAHNKGVRYLNPPE